MDTNIQIHRHSKWHQQWSIVIYKRNCTFNICDPKPFTINNVNVLIYLNLNGKSYFQEHFRPSIELCLRTKYIRYIYWCNQQHGFDRYNVVIVSEIDISNINSPKNRVLPYFTFIDNFQMIYLCNYKNNLNKNSFIKVYALIAFYFLSLIGQFDYRTEIELHFLNFGNFS